jgi:O-antigen/teichoic acid export membrane protein
VVIVISKIKELTQRFLDGNITTLAKNSSWLLGAEFVTVAVNTALAFIVPKYLGVFDYGLIALVFAYVTILNQVIDFRIHEAATKYMSGYLVTQEKDKLFAVIKLCYGINFVTGVAAFAVVIATASLASTHIMHSAVAVSLIGIYAVKLLFSIVDGTSTSILTVFNRFPRLSVTNGACSVILLLLVICAVYFDYGVLGIMYTYVAASILTSIVLLVFAGLTVKEENLLGYRASKISLIRDKWKEIGSFIFNTNINETFVLFIRNIDMLILGYFRSPTEAGYYRLAKSIASLYTFLGFPLSNAIYPQLSRLWCEGKVAEFKSVLKKSTVALAAVTITSSILLAAVVPYLISAIVGPSFLPSVTPVRIMLVGMIVSTTLFWTRGAFLSFGRPGVCTWVNGFCAVTMFLLSLVVVQAWGYVGSAVMFSYPFLLGQAILLVIFFRYMKSPASPCTEETATHNVEGVK